MGGNGRAVVSRKARDIGIGCACTRRYARSAFGAAGPREKAGSMVDTEDAARAWLSTLPECDGPALERLEQLIALLREENAKQNLVSSTSLDEIWRRHIVDSA